MTGSSGPRAYRARWIFAEIQEPLENGTVLLGEDGLVNDITARHVTAAIDLGNVALIPGLVNAHTHLEFSHLTTPVEPANPFTDWIGNVIAARNLPVPTVADRIAQGIGEVEQTGTTLVGEIATEEDSANLLRQSNLAGVVYHELIGLSDSRVAQQREKLEQLARLAEMKSSKRESENSQRANARGSSSPQATQSWKHGISPHAPYSVRFDLLAAVVETAKSHNLPVCMHLAEQPAERELIAGKGGLFRDFLESLGLYDAAHWSTPKTILDYLELLASAPQATVIHGNDLQAAEWEFLASQPQLSVVYCPRTHAYFEHPPHPWNELLKRGVNVALGTDGRSSNPDLELWREVQFLASRSTDIAPEVLLQMATNAGCQALGVDADSGLSIGKNLRVTVLDQLPEHETDPWRAIFAESVQARQLV